MKMDTILPFMITLQIILILVMFASIKFTVCAVQDVQKMLELFNCIIFAVAMVFDALSVTI